MTGVSVWATVPTAGVTELVTGASAPAASLVTDTSVPVTGASDCVAVATVGVSTPVTGARNFVAVEATDPAAPVGLLAEPSLAATAPAAGVTDFATVDATGATMSAAGAAPLAAALLASVPDGDTVSATGARDSEALAVTDAELDDPGLEDPPVEGADPSLAGAGLAAATGCAAVASPAGASAPTGAGSVVGAASPAPATALSAEPTTELAALVTEPTTPVSGFLTAEDPADPADAGPVTAEAADVVAEFSPGWSSCAAAWACLEKINRRKRIPAATIANCAARTTARFASSCGIDSSYPRGTSPYTAGTAKAPDKPCTADEDEALCTATTVHHSPVARQAIRREAYARRPWLDPMTKMIFDSALA